MRRGKLTIVRLSVISDTILNKEAILPVTVREGVNHVLGRFSRVLVVARIFLRVVGVRRFFRGTGSEQLLWSALVCGMAGFHANSAVLNSATTVP
jgi:hypothetical protein